MFHKGILQKYSGILRICLENAAPRLYIKTSVGIKVKALCIE
jgi:hypothetical protein